MLKCFLGQAECFVCLFQADYSVSLLLSFGYVAELFRTVRTLLHLACELGTKHEETLLLSTPEHLSASSQMYSKPPRSTDCFCGDRYWPEMPLEKKAAVSQCRLHGTPDEYLKQQEVDLTQEEHNSY